MIESKTEVTHIIDAEKFKFFGVNNVNGLSQKLKAKIVTEAVLLLEGCDVFCFSVKFRLTFIFRSCRVVEGEQFPHCGAVQHDDHDRKVGVINESLG